MRLAEGQHKSSDNSMWYATVKKVRDFGTTTPAKSVFFGYLTYCLIGSILLWLPVSRNVPVPFLDNLFTAVSAVSTTGLVTVSISDSYNFWGELIVLILIQLGGIGYMTLGSFVLLSLNQRISLGREEISKTVFPLPQGFRIDKFIRSVIFFTLITEFFGAYLLYIMFMLEGTPAALWSAVFHSVSAFCTAGFSLYNNSFENFRFHFWINIIISILSYAGAMGFLLFVDLWRRYNGEIHKISFTSRIILKTTLLLTLAGTLIMYLTEPSFKALQPGERLLVSFFQTMSAFTTVGYNTVSLITLSQASIMLIVVLMIIGSSPSGTGGGLKSTNVATIIALILSSIRGSTHVTLMKREIPPEQTSTAAASISFYIILLCLGTFFLTLSESASFMSVLFEAASAIGTVGLSIGITSSLSVLGKMIVMILMFIGRLGPLTFGIALFSSAHPKKVYTEGNADIAR